MKNLWTWLGGVCVPLVLAVGVELGSARLPDDPGDAAMVLDSALGTNKRVQALDRLWAGVEGGSVERANARETLKQVLWKGSAPAPLREEALAKLFSDGSEEGRADTRKLLRLRLPTEAQWPLIGAMCGYIKERAAGGDAVWRELAGPLVRSYARRVPLPTDAERAERPALLAIFPGKSIEEAVFEVYLHPTGGEEAAGPAKPGDVVEKQRQAAWELLGRLDPDGAKRRVYLAGAPPGGNDAAITVLSRAAGELRVVPITGSELAWVKGLIESKDAGAGEWWGAAQAAVAGLSEGQTKGLQLRHIEPVRWASKHRPEWLAADRAGLLSELSARLEPRRKWRKTEGLGADELMSRELLSDWQDQMVYGDVLAVLVIDEALRDQAVVESLFKQAAADRADTSTEYGGVLMAGDAAPVETGPGGKVKSRWEAGIGGAGFVVHGYAARPVQRVNDRTFVAPEEMFDADKAGGRALAHYHFHAQSVNNADYAGPGKGDFEYAAAHGRSCIVFTSVRAGVLNADYYQRSDTSGKSTGLDIDLGEVKSDR